MSEEPLPTEEELYETVCRLTDAVGVLVEAGDLRGVYQLVKAHPAAGIVILHWKIQESVERWQNQIRQENMMMATLTADRAKLTTLQRELDARAAALAVLPQGKGAL
jgi:hypothetical protein